MKGIGFPRRKGPTESVQRLGRQISQTQSSTTSFLTATTLIYAIGAGITAAAGHRSPLAQRGRDGLAGGD